MCQSKAEGGRRCAFHLEQAATAAVISYTTSTTKLTTKEATEAYKDLEREGLNQPDPSREEIDQFLSTEAFRVRHEPNLTEKRRNSIVARLQAAIGRVTPNGATFHAWKNMVAEAWSRVRRKAAAAFLIGAVTFSVGACGNAPSSPTPDHASPVAAATQTPGPSTSASTSPYKTDYTVATPNINSAATQTFGSQNAQDGTNAAVDFSEKAFYDQTCFTTPAGTDVDKCLGTLGQYMTSESKSDWDNSIKGFLADASSGNYGQSQDSGNVLSLTFYGGLVGTQTLSDGRKLQAVSSGPTFVNQKISKIDTSVNSDGNLMVKVKSSADARVDIDGKSNLWHFSRSCTYYMKQVDGNWKIDGWNGGFTPGSFTPES